MTPFSKSIKKQTLAEQVAESIKTSILAGDLAAGDPLPTEPRLCEQFGVSRAVVRDATRLLMAQGLVDAKQGSGVYVTPARNDFFGDALLLSLKRVEGTAWDVEEFERILLPEVAALAASAATETDIARLRCYLDDYLTCHARYVQVWHGVAPGEIPTAETIELEERIRELAAAIFEATHNWVLILLADSLIMLRGMRRWQGPEITAERIIETERGFLVPIVDAVCNRDPQAARAAVANIQRLPDEAIAAMRVTPVGETIHINTRDADSLSQ